MKYDFQTINGIKRQKEISITKKPNIIPQKDRGTTS